MGAHKCRLLLLVENPDVGGILQLALRDYEMEWHAQPEPAHDAFKRRTFDAAIVDLSFGGLPRGLDVIREWRAAGAAFPIVALSDVTRSGLVVESMSAGADDFLRKPFHHEELVARVGKLVARNAGGSTVRKAGGVILAQKPFKFAGATVTPDLMVKFPDGTEERIRPKEHGILKYFAGHAGGLAMKGELVMAVWGSDANDAGHSVNEYISVLRRMFVRHGIDFNGLVTSEPKAGWRIGKDA